MNNFNKWWRDHINLSCDRGYPAPNQAAKAAWDHQQAKVAKLQAELKTVIYKHAEAEHTIIKLRAKVASNCHIMSNK